MRQLTGKLLRASPECRARFEKLLAEEPAQVALGKGQDGSFRQPIGVEARSSDAVRAPEVAVPGPGGEKRVNPSPEGEQPAEAKKPKAESPSRKCEAEGPPEAPEEEKLPTIHDCMHACGVVAHGSRRERGEVLRRTNR